MFLLAPEVSEDTGDQDALAALQGISLDTSGTWQSTYGCLCLLPQKFLVLIPLEGRRR